MTDNKKWAVTIHRAGEAPNSVGYEGPDEKSAIDFVANELELDVDDDGNVAGDPQIVRLAAEEDPDIFIQHEEQ